MKKFNDPFQYPEPFKASELPERKEAALNKRREYRAKKLGRPIGKHGGYRPGAGRPRIRNYTHMVPVFLDRIQVKLLEELGQGNLHQGIQQALERYCDG